MDTSYNRILTKTLPKHDHFKNFKIENQDFMPIIIRACYRQKNNHFPFTDTVIIGLQRYFEKNL